ncbi:MAG: 6,7-dimethyl-8-ribityllumazine synthase [Bacteroidota bacterium]
MSTAHQSLSHHQAHEMPNAEPFRFGIVVAEWNHSITDAMATGAIRFLKDAGALENNIVRMNVPGSFELTAGASMMAQENFDAIICIGCVIQGETRHFDFICDAVANGITNLTIKYNKPFIFGVLTTDNLDQAIDRSGGKHGNKGIEAAATALKMVTLKNK